MKRAFSGGNAYYYHKLRPWASSDYPYVPTRIDNSQTTEILITSDGGATERHKIHLFTRDKFSFRVGGALTIENVEFTGGDSDQPIDRDP